MDELTPQQELFCRFYTQNSELFGHVTLSYAEAYGYDLDSLSKEKPLISEEPKKYGDSEYDLAYNTCAANGSRLLRNDKIQKRVITLLNEYMRDEVVDAELVKVIMQNYKLESKVAAIREYNKLKQRITEKTDITTNGESINTGEISALTHKLNEIHRGTSESGNGGVASSLG